MSNTQNTQVKTSIANTEIFSPIDDSQASSVSGGFLGALASLAISAAPTVIDFIKGAVND
jgi:hypothetical protein